MYNVQFGVTVKIFAQDSVHKTLEHLYLPIGPRGVSCSDFVFIAKSSAEVFECWSVKFTTCICSHYMEGGPSPSYVICYHC